MLKLIFIDQNFVGQVYDLAFEKTTVGRSDESTLVIHDNSISAAHCEIVVDGSEVFLRDLDSRNGTFIDDIRVKNQPTRLKIGQSVRFGAVEARLELDAVDLGPSSEITAVHAHSRYVNAMQQLRKHRKSINASTHLRSKTSPMMQEHTVRLPIMVLNELIAAPTASKDVETNANAVQQQQHVFIAAVVILFLIVLAWLLWRN
jgi:predicted component of type VI protein secretion system